MSEDRQENIGMVLLAFTTFIVVLAVLMAVGCTSGQRPTVNVPKAWGEGGMEIELRQLPALGDLDMMWRVKQDSFGHEDEFINCTIATVVVNGIVIEGLIPGISDDLCTSERGHLPFGVRSFLPIQVEADSTGEE